MPRNSNAPKRIRSMGSPSVAGDPAPAPTNTGLTGARFQQRGEAPPNPFTKMQAIAQASAQAIAHVAWRAGSPAPRADRRARDGADSGLSSRLLRLRNYRARSRAGRASLARAGAQA